MLITVNLFLNFNFNEIHTTADWGENRDPMKHKNIKTQKQKKIETKVDERRILPVDF